MLINSLASIQDGDRLQETVPMLVQAVDNWAANGICDHPLVLAVAIPRSRSGHTRRRLAGEGGTLVDDTAWWAGRGNDAMRRANGNRALTTNGT